MAGTSSNLLPPSHHSQHSIPQSSLSVRPRHTPHPTFAPPPSVPLFPVVNYCAAPPTPKTSSSPLELCYLSFSLPRSLRLMLQ
ncbi:hypothetical protein LZ31DRAFT_548248 [Colletotrichum somersetense]|nr:hypothetical protein LZ31DRAFT_548248 [Colletotrichum somersetense]